MRRSVVATLLASACLVAGLHARGEEPKAESTEIAATAEDVEDKPFTPPPGFRERKRGEVTVYCRREEPNGTRFRKEVCYDEAQLRQMVNNTREDQISIDQTRRIMGTDLMPR